MAKLTTATRNRLPSSKFAEPGKRAYPIENASHARNALARVSQFGSPAEKATVRAAVHRKYPGIGMKQGTSHESNGEGMLERGHFETHVKKAKSAELSHQEFHKLDHGVKDHMPSRKSEKAGY